MLSNIIAICNQKGGVGKTTTAINLAAALSAVGKKILIIDLDPQGNASTGLGVEYSNRKKSIYEALAKSIPFDESIQQTQLENLYIVPSNVELSGIESELANDNDKAFILKSLLSNSTTIKTFDYIFIDCPPALSLLTVMAMTAANSVLVPLQCEFFALEGLSQLIKTVDRVQKNLNPEKKRNPRRFLPSLTKTSTRPLSPSQNLLMTPFSIRWKSPKTTREHPSRCRWFSSG